MRRAALFLALAAGLALTAPGLAATRQFRCDNLAERAEKTDLNARVYQGDAGWFFRDSDLNTFYMYSPQTMRFLTRLSAVLKARGVTLALMPLPPKSVLAPTHSAAATTDGEVLFDPAFARAEFAGLVASLRAAGIATADVLALADADQGSIDGDFFFARDIHWRPRLADVSARAVASLLLGLDPAIGGNKSFTTVKVGPAMNESNTNSIFNQLCAEPIPAETFEIYRTEQSNQSANDFLGEGDVAPPVDLVGTSFTDEAKPYNFSGFLRQALGADVAAYSISGGGVDTAIYKWAHERRADRAGLKALVWELPYPERLEPVAATLSRQVVPAIVGGCEGKALASQQFTTAPGESASLGVPPELSVSGDGYYIAASLSEPAATAFTLAFDYRDNRHDVLPLVRPDRVTGLTTLFGDLNADIDAPLGGITLTNRNSMPVSVTLSLCSYPDGVLASAATSTGKASS